MTEFYAKVNDMRQSLIYYSIRPELAPEHRRYESPEVYRKVLLGNMDRMQKAEIQCRQLTEAGSSPVKVILSEASQFVRLRNSMEIQRLAKRMFDDPGGMTGPGRIGNIPLGLNEETSVSQVSKLRN